MKQSIIEILKARIDEQGVKVTLIIAMDTAIELLEELERYFDNSDSLDLDVCRKTRIALIAKMVRTQEMLWELQLMLGIDDLEKQTEDYIEWRELQSIPH